MFVIVISFRLPVMTGRGYARLAVIARTTPGFIGRFGAPLGGELLKLMADHQEAQPLINFVW